MLTSQCREHLARQREYAELTGLLVLAVRAAERVVGGQSTAALLPGPIGSLRSGLRSPSSGSVVLSGAVNLDQLVPV